MTATRIAVAGDQPYDVVVGTGLLDELPALLAGAQRVLLVHPRALADRVGALERRLLAAGLEVTPAAVPDGEAAKAADVAGALWSLLGRTGFTRSDAVVALGGGATTDLAGFVAATWLRGVRVVHVPTTVLGMVDAAVGGKTAIDTGEGKNLVGAFHPPAGVLCDLQLLVGLPAVELASGLAEVVKAGFIADPAILDLVEDAPQDALDVSGAVLPVLVERAVQVKAAVVGADLRESGLRETLNYGHTLGHAIEKVERWSWRHGDAVSIGMVYAAELGAELGTLDRAGVDRHRRLLDSLGLPTAYERRHWPALLATMRVDKKARGSRLRFVVLEGVGSATVVDAPGDDVLEAVYERVSA